jgi:hypothetical protein
MPSALPRRSWPRADWSLQRFLSKRHAAEPFVVGVGAVAAFGVYAWLARFGLDLADEGYFMDLATRVMNGQLPYRDFDTYYTPGMFYMEAVIFSLFGVSVTSARLLMIGIRVACGLLLYRLARRVVPWPFAALPPLIMLAADLSIESHPAWPALLGTLLMLEMLAGDQLSLQPLDSGNADIGRCDRRGSAVWLVLAGASAGIAFAFKQNVGAFAILGGVSYVLLRPRPRAGPLVITLRLVYALSLAVTVRRFLANTFDELVALTIWLPLVATLLLLLSWSSDIRLGIRRGHWTLRGVADRLDAVALDTAWFGMGLAAVTLAWLGALVAELGPSNTPFGLFLGNVNQGALTFPLEAPPLGTPWLAVAALWLPLVIVAMFQRPVWKLVAPVASAAMASLLLPLLPIRAASLDPLVTSIGFFPRLEWLDLQFGSLYLYLSALAAWSGLLLLIPLRTAGTSPPTVAWYLLVGVLAQLALYPRADTVHALFAGSPLLLVGAWVLARVHHRLAASISRAGQALVFAALLLVPLVATLPHAYGRYISLAHPEAGAAVTTYVPFGLERAAVLVHEPVAEDLRDAVAYVQQGTPPGEPFFAYPVDPLANVLTDRPNPTRFDHFLPGALTPENMHEVIASLEQARPRYILWDHAAVVFWGTDRPNRLLSDYIWRCYQQVAAFHLLLILERSTC